MIIFDVILPCLYCFHRVHPYWKMIVLFLSNKCLSHLQFSPQLLTFIIVYAHTGKLLSYYCLTALCLILWLRFDDHIRWYSVMSLLFSDMVYIHTGKWLYYSCFTAVCLQLRFDNHIWCYSAMSLLFLSCAPILENYCIILVLQLSFYNSDLMIIVDVILPSHYCFHSVHPYWKIIVLFLFYSCLFTTQIWWS